MPSIAGVPRHQALRAAIVGGLGAALRVSILASMGGPLFPRQALACTCTAWRRALWHPAFWKVFQLPSFSNNTMVGLRLESQPPS